MKVTLADLSVTHLREARIEIAFEGKVSTVRAIVLKDGAPAILLDVDHPLTRSLLEGRRPIVDDPIPCHVRAITRVQSQAQEKEQVDNLASDAWDGAVPSQVKLAAPPIDKTVRQDKGQTHKEPAFNVHPCESSPPVVVGPVEGASSEADPNTSPQMEEWAEVVWGECLIDRSDIEEIGEVGMEKGNPWGEMAEADNLLGLEREDIEASDQPLRHLAEGKEDVRVLASQQRKIVVWLRWEEWAMRGLMGLWWREWGVGPAEVNDPWDGGKKDGSSHSQKKGDSRCYTQGISRWPLFTQQNIWLSITAIYLARSAQGCQKVLCRLFRLPESGESSQSSGAINDGTYYINPLPETGSRLDSPPRKD